MKITLTKDEAITLLRDKFLPDAEIVFEDIATNGEVYKSAVATLYSGLHAPSRIPFIKFHRYMTGCGLMEAKNFIESIT